jgi:hypothetical protein
VTDDTDRLAARLDAVERALTDGETDLQDLDDAAALADRVARLEARVDDLERTQERLDGAVQAVRGYAGAVRAVNRTVERRADAALAAVDRLAADEPVDLDLPDAETDGPHRASGTDDLHRASEADDPDRASETDVPPTGEGPADTAERGRTGGPCGADAEAGDDAADETSDDATRDTFAARVRDLL